MALIKEFEKQGNFLFVRRSFLPLLIVIPGLWVFYSNPKICETNRLYDCICIVVALLGTFIRIITIGYSSDQTSGRNTTEGQIAETVNKTGMYSTVRHPLYLGNFFMWLGLAMMTNHFWFIIAFILYYALYYERIMYAEESFLINKFGEEYTQWAGKTPAIIPAFGEWQKPKLTFSFIKVIRQEKSGILNLFIIFFIFSLIKSYKCYGFENFKLDKFFTYLLAFALLYYTIIKIIQKTGKLDRDR